ncbi:MAG TPA: PilT/PilU family type 4a pilus ATPase [Candidatus Marinimicrobia bacterium]|nr:PilT/PilU family type 4a pilus ATPase [Candidatus Neomarinimicrobiota bacterium]HRS51755.1 PilT/PilU family type 4a pilus ATPase [Candidatus Neomarinimicrobiota bacterium]HRU93018.1 PilT/PilU family type 4a pilus ATPase [Candidatus Neomarinimicrobiota bacterium]
MGLSFTPEMEIALPEYLMGTARFKNINKLITFNSAWKKEAYDNLKSLLRKMEEIDASDIDIGGSLLDVKIWYRVYGRKYPDPEAKRYSNDEVTAILLSILSDDQKIILFDKKNIDFSLGISFGENEEANRFRGDIYYDNDVLVGNFRRVNRELFPIEKLNIPDPILKKLNLRHEKSGLILVTGITGSGKSTTLDSIINLNNKENEGHIVIISDPLEFIHKSNKCIIRHREVGGDVLSFREGTIQALRQDPDIIIVGEMRDAPTIATVLEATDSGHKVFTTLHTSSAVESIHRIIAEFLPEEQERIRLRLADTLSVVISQKLVPDRDGKLTLAKEILSVTDSVKAAIRNKNIGEIYQMITEGKKYGMVTMEQDLYNLYSKKIISRENALDYSNNRKRIEQLFSYQEIIV